MSRKSFNDVLKDVLDQDLPYIELKSDKIYLKEKNGYSFHIFHVPEKSNERKGNFVTELYYNLKDKEYWVKRNDRKVKFSVVNIDPIFPKKGFNNEDSFHDKFFNFISTEHNKGLYSFAFNYLGRMDRERTVMLGRFFYRLIKDYSYIETLYKTGMSEYDIKDAIIDDSKANKPNEILGLNKTEWKTYSRYKDRISLRLLQVASRNISPSFDHNKKSRELLNYLSLIEKLDDKYGLEKMKTFLRREVDYIYRGHSYASIINLSDRYGLNTKRAIEYAYYETNVSQGMEGIYDVLSYWSDYLRMSKDMGLTNVDKYPRYLKTMHDVVSMNYRLNISEIQRKQFEQAYNVNKKYHTEDREHILFAPETPEDLVREGNQMGHCVGSYVKNVCRQTSAILFLRKKKQIDKSYITIEIKDGNIVQAKCKMNALPDEEQRKVIEDFAESMQLNIIGY